MNEGDQEHEGEGSKLEALIELVDVMFPDRYRLFTPRRRINFDEDRKVGLEHLEPATAALDDLSSDREVDLEVVIKILDCIKYLNVDERDADRLRARVVAHVERRWHQFHPQLANRVVQHYGGAALLKSFPQLQSSPVFLSQLADALRQSKSTTSWIVDLLSKLEVFDLAAARVLIAGLMSREREDTELSTALFLAIARNLGWTPWVSLMAVLVARPDYADKGALFEARGDETRESKPTIAARLEMARALENQTKVRAVAAMLLELTATNAGWSDTGVLARPAETRAAYVEGLQALIAEDDDLRRCVIEALLWLPTNQAADLAQFAAAALAAAIDREFLLELEQHGVRLVQYGARAVRAARFNDRIETGELPTPGGLVQSIAALENPLAISDEPAKTWLGDRNIERLIESTIAAVEAKVAAGYNCNGDQGEDRLLSSLFAVLADRFAALDTALEAMARAASAPHRAAVAMRYRNVDRPEEGDKGIKGAPRFAADLCLIVDPEIDGTSLGRRVTLVQAKRVYRNKKAKKQPAWERSFKLDREQRLALQQQTHSSVYFFFAPPLGGRGVPVIPTQLVADLSELKGTGGTLRREVVAVASRSLADWLTYDALSLRVGDPYAELLKKAEGEPGGVACDLLEIPTVEIDIALVPRSERDRR